MNLFGWVFVLVAFSTVKFMVIAQFVGGTEPEPLAELPTFPDATEFTNVTEDFNPRPVGGLDAVADVLFNIFQVIKLVVGYIIAFVTFVFGIIVFIVLLIGFLIGLLPLLFNTFGDAAPWYINVLILTPQMFAILMCIFKLFRSGDDNE